MFNKKHQYMKLYICKDKQHVSGEYFDMDYCVELRDSVLVASLNSVGCQLVKRCSPVKLSVIRYFPHRSEAVSSTAPCFLAVSHLAFL